MPPLVGVSSHTPKGCGFDPWSGQNLYCGFDLQLGAHTYTDLSSIKDNKGNTLVKDRMAVGLFKIRAHKNTLCNLWEPLEEVILHASRSYHTFFHRVYTQVTHPVDTKSVLALSTPTGPRPRDRGGAVCFLWLLP